MRARRWYVYARCDIDVHTVTCLRGSMTGMLLCAMWFKLRVFRLRQLTIILCALRSHVTHFGGFDLRPTELWFRASAGRAPLRRVSTTRRARRSWQELAIGELQQCSNRRPRWLTPPHGASRQAYGRSVGMRLPPRNLSQSPRRVDRTG